MPLVSLGILQAYFLLIFSGQSLFYLLFNPTQIKDLQFPINRIILQSDPGVVFKSLLFFLMLMSALFLVARNVVRRKEKKKLLERMKPIAVPVLYLFTFHLQFLVCLFAFDFHRQSPYFIVVSILAMSCEYLIIDRMALHQE